MCRWPAYSGSPILLETFLLQPDHSLIDQSLHARMGVETTNGDGFVNVTDLLAVLGAWGPCPGCPEDINADGFVNVTDLLAVLSAWGPCE